MAKYFYYKRFPSWLHSKKMKSFTTLERWCYSCFLDLAGEAEGLIDYKKSDLIEVIGVKRHILKRFIEKALNEGLIEILQNVSKSSPECLQNVSKSKNLIYKISHWEAIQKSSNVSKSSPECLQNVSKSSPVDVSKKSCNEQDSSEKEILESKLLIVKDKVKDRSIYMPEMKFQAEEKEVKEEQITKKKSEPSKMFLDLWNSWTGNKGSRKAAWGKYEKYLKDFSEDELVTAGKEYLKTVRYKPQFTMWCQKFYGPDEYFKEYLKADQLSVEDFEGGL